MEQDSNRFSIFFIKIRKITILEDILSTQYEF